MNKRIFSFYYAPEHNLLCIGPCGYSAAGWHELDAVDLDSASCINNGRVEAVSWHATAVIQRYEIPLPVTIDLAIPKTK